MRTYARITGILLGVLTPLVVSAYTLTDSGWDCTGFAGCSSYGGNLLSYAMNRILLIISTFLFALTVLVFFYGAIRMAISQGEEGKETGRKAMLYAAGGFILVLLLNGIFRFICDYLYALGEGSLLSASSMCAQWWW